MKMNIQVRGGDAFERKLKRHPDAIRKIVETETRAAARSLAVRYSASTMPLGNGESAAREEMKRIDYDISRLFPSSQRSENDWRIFKMIKKNDAQLASMWWRAVKDGNEAWKVKILRKARLPKGVSDGAHQAARKGARVPGSADAVSVAAASRQRALVKRTQKKVGFAKAAWYAAAMSLGGRLRTKDTKTGKSVNTIPKFVRRLKNKASRYGGGRFIGGVRPYAEIWNKVPYIHTAINKKGEAFARAAAEGDYAKRLKHRIAAENKKRFG